MKNIFGKDKISYKSIEVFEEVETIIIKTIDNKKNKNIYGLKLSGKSILILSGLIIVLLILINII